MKRLLLLAAALPVVALAGPALAETVNCTNITALPHTITAPGVYCLKQDLNTSMTSGAAITINANSVTIDFNGYKLGGLGAGPATTAKGVAAEDRKNITLRNGNIRGFRRGISIGESVNGASSGHVIESNLLDSNTEIGIVVTGSGVLIQDNRVLNTSGALYPQGISAALRNSRIVGNLISGTVSPTGTPYAVFVSIVSANVEVAGNTILDTRGDYSAFGILSASSGSVAAGNVVIGVTAAAADGISNTNGGSLICRDNTVANVTTNPTSGCTSESGTFPPVAP